VFIGEFLSLLPMENGQDISSAWETALKRTEKRMEEIGDVLERMAGAAGAVEGDQFGVLGMVNGFVSGASFNVGYEIEVTGFGIGGYEISFGIAGDEISFGNGGYENGFRGGLRYLRSLQPVK
jgi:hypothetical protein